MKSLRYIAPELKVYLIATERGYVGSMLEDPIEDTRQDW